MPQIPLYGLQANPPPARAFQVTPTGAAAQAGQIDQAGDLIMRRGAQLAEQFDTTQATQAFNAWDDEERNFLTNTKDGLFSTQGSQAYGVQDRYNEWHDQSSGKVRTSLKNSNQVAIFDKLASRSRETSLNRLAAHEIHQHKLNQQDAESGFITKGMIKVRETALDQTMDANGERPADTYIRTMKENVASINAGFLSAKQMAAIEQEGRASQIESMIDAKAFPMAQTELEKHKDTLGSKYHTLAARMKAQVQDSALGAAYAGLQQKNGSNYVASLSEINNQKNWAVLFPNLSDSERYDAAAKLNERFSGLWSEQIRMRDNAERNLQLSQHENDAKALADQLSGKVLDLPTLTRNRTISTEMSKHLSARREGAKRDNFLASGAVEDMILRSTGTAEELRAIDLKLAEFTSGTDPQLRDETAAGYAKAARSEAYKRAKALVDSAAKPGEFDKWDPDRNQRYVRFSNEFAARLQAGDDYYTAANHTIASFMADVRSVAKNLAAPEKLPAGTSKTDPQALKAAREATSAASVQKGPVWSKKEFDKIEALERAISDLARSAEKQSELDKIVQKRTSGK